MPSSSYKSKDSPRDSNYSLTVFAKFSASNAYKIFPDSSNMSLSVGLALRAIKMLSTPLFFDIISQWA
jgi:hypothetical protein